MSGREPEWPPKEWGKELNGVGKAVTGPLAGSLEFGREARLPLNGSVSPLADFSSSARGKVLALPGMLDPMPAEEEPVEERGEQYLICLLAGYECGIKAEYVQAVERLPDVTPVPNVAHWISGVINLRGQIISIVDLRAFLGLEPQPLSPRTRLIAGRVGEMVIGLVVDGVSEMRGILGEMIQLQGIARALPAWATPYVGGVATIGSQSVMLLDLERLLLSEKMHQYQS